MTKCRARKGMLACLALAGLVAACGQESAPRHANRRSKAPALPVTRTTDGDVTTPEAAGIESLDPRFQVAYIHAFVNAVRVKAGLNAVSLDDALNAYAMRASEDIAAGHPVHEMLNGMSRDQKVAAGFCRGGSENQAPGWTMTTYRETLDAILAAMMEVKTGNTHRENILDPAAARMGVGFVTKGGKLFLTIAFSQACG